MRFRLVVVCLLAFGCVRLPDGPGTTQTVVVTVTPPTPTPSTGPTTGPGSACPNIPRMRVSFFGFRPGCANPPRNGQGILPMDCVADATATPIGVDGNPVPSTVHGFNITWASFSSGPGRIRLVEDSDNPFNRVAIPDSVGEVTLSATLTPPGCTGSVTGEFNVRVVPAGVRS